MTKRYREPLESVELATMDRHGDAVPVAFSWRGRRYRTLQVLGHWREDPGWWRRGDGEPMRIEQSDLWRVEAQRGRRRDGAGVYELAWRGGEWRLHRVWD